MGLVRVVKRCQRELSDERYLCSVDAPLKLMPPTVHTDVVQKASESTLFSGGICAGAKGVPYGAFRFPYLIECSIFLWLSTLVVRRNRRRLLCQSVGAKYSGVARVISGFPCTLFGRGEV